MDTVVFLVFQDTQVFQGFQVILAIQVFLVTVAFLEFLAIQESQAHLVIAVSLAIQA